MELTITNIKALLETKNKHVIGRALVALNKRQTEDEQRIKITKYRNGRGFRPCHAHMGTSMANFYEERDSLTEKQIRYWTIPSQRTRKGLGGTRSDPKVSRISLYASQLLKVAQIKQGIKNCPYVYIFEVDTGGRKTWDIPKMKKWCKECIECEWFHNSEDPFAGFRFADKGDMILFGLKWS